MLGNRILYNRNTSINMIITIMPILMACILNMLFTKTELYKNHRYPIDGYRRFRGKRILGDNKTWIGGMSLILLSMITMISWGLLLKICKINYLSEYYQVNNNDIYYNIWIGFINGLIYIISELPNSFTKRQLNIESGKTAGGLKGLLFFIIDQIDSLIGIALVLKIVSGINWIKCIKYIIFGGTVHIITNIILYNLKIRKNI